MADIDLGLISLAKAAADPGGHYARPDVTRLLLNKSRREPVVLERRAGPAPEAFEVVDEAGGGGTNIAG